MNKYLTLQVIQIMTREDDTHYRERKHRHLAIVARPLPVCGIVHTFGSTPPRPRASLGLSVLGSPRCGVRARVRVTVRTQWVPFRVRARVVNWNSTVQCPLRSLQFAQIRTHVPGPVAQYGSGLTGACPGGIGVQSDGACHGAWLGSTRVTVGMGGTGSEFEEEAAGCNGVILEPDSENASSPPASCARDVAVSDRA